MKYLKECKLYGLKNHEKYCEQNPNRIDYPIHNHLNYYRSHTVWNKGLTAETDERIQKTAESLKKYYETHDGTFVGKIHSSETKAKISKSIKEAIKNNPS